MAYSVAAPDRMSRLGFRRLTRLGLDGLQSYRWCASVIPTTLTGYRREIRSPEACGVVVQMHCMNNKGL
jgi:hypothetical protein